MSEDFFSGEQPTLTPGDVGTVPAADLSMDALFEKAVDMDDVRKTEADALRPVGTYLTVPKLSLTGRTPSTRGVSTSASSGSASWW